MYTRRIQILSPPFPVPAFGFPGRMLRRHERVTRRIVGCRLWIPLHDAQSPTIRRRLEVEWQIAVVAFAEIGAGQPIEHQMSVMPVPFLNAFALTRRAPRCRRARASGPAHRFADDAADRFDAA